MEASKRRGCWCLSSESHVEKVLDVLEDKGNTRNEHFVRVLGWVRSSSCDLSKMKDSRKFFVRLFLF